MLDDAGEVQTMLASVEASRREEPVHGGACERHCARASSATSTDSSCGDIFGRWRGGELSAGQYDGGARSDVRSALGADSTGLEKSFEDRFGWRG
jgi:hypothetical protein